MLVYICSKYAKKAFWGFGMWLHPPFPHYSYKNPPFSDASYLHTPYWYGESSQLSCHLVKTIPSIILTLVSSKSESCLILAGSLKLKSFSYQENWKFLLLLLICLSWLACLASHKPVGGVLANSNWIYRTWT